MENFIKKEFLDRRLCEMKRIGMVITSLALLFNLVGCGYEQKVYRNHVNGYDVMIRRDGINVGRLDPDGHGFEYSVFGKDHLLDGDLDSLSFEKVPRDSELYKMVNAETLQKLWEELR